MTAAGDVFEAPPISFSPSRHKRSAIKMVTAIIRPERMDALKDGLGALNLVGGITLTDVRGSGRQRGGIEHYMGVAYQRRFLPKVKVEIAVPEEDVETILDLVRQLSRTGAIGDGKAFVTPVLASLRIRTGERGVDAL